MYTQPIKQKNPKPNGKHLKKKNNLILDYGEKKQLINKKINKMRSDGVKC